MDHWEDWAELESQPELLAIQGTDWDEQRSRERLDYNIEHWERHGFGQWLFFDKDTDQIVGRTGLRKMNVDDADEHEIGYWVHPAYWRRKLGYEMTSAAVKVAEQRTAIGSLVAFARVDNDRSIGLMEKLGFHYEKDIMHAELPHVLYRMNVFEDTDSGSKDFVVSASIQR